ncbi:MAG: hypothetical protein ACFE85_06840 [Candidatus Hodarchaeota archaeon]
MNIVNSIKKFVYSEKIVVGFIISFILAFLLELTGLFLLMLLAGGVAGFFIKRGWISFITGFMSVALAWGIYFIVFTFIGPLSEFLEVIGSIIGISGVILMMLSLIIGGLLGGTGALVGAYFTQLILGDNYIRKSKNITP